jgi:hypothetical protein
MRLHKIKVWKCVSVGKRSLGQVNVDPHWAQNPRPVQGEELNLVISPLVTV